MDKFGTPQLVTKTANLQVVSERAVASCCSSSLEKLKKLASQGETVDACCPTCGNRMEIEPR